MEPEGQAAIDNARAIFDARSELYGDSDPTTIESLIRLADALQIGGNYREAEGLLRSSLSIQNRAANGDESWTTLTEFNLAIVLDRLGENPAARRLWERVLQSSDRTKGPDSEQSVRAAINLAISLRKLHLCGDEFPLRVRILEATRRSAGPEHVDTFRAVIDLAQTHRELGNHEMALSLFVEGLSGLERCDVDQRTLLYQKWAIASELVALKRPREASEMFDQVLQGSIEHLPADDPLRRSAVRQKRAYWFIGKVSRRKKIRRREKAETDST
jgi:tetratricopeptide (TPR) repeat protein